MHPIPISAWKSPGWLLLVLISTLDTVHAADPPADPQPQTPEVFALVVGITDYGQNNGSASKAAAGARRFADVIKKTYGETAVKHLLLDDNATRDNVEEALFAIQHVAPGSLVIIYFSGHGVRAKFDTGSMLYLRLYGSSDRKYVAHSIKAPDLWRALTYTRYTNAMIFLDCCYAGSDEPEIVPEAELNNVNSRAFLMCACSKDEVATGDVFNRALLQVWTTAHEKNGACMTLSDFESRVRAVVRKLDKGYMTPGIAFKTRIARCITHMDGPSALLTLTFPNGCRAGLTFVFNGMVVEDAFQYARDVFFTSQVSLDRPLEVVVKGPDGDTVAGPFNINPKDALPRRILEFPIPVPKKYASDTAQHQATAGAYNKLADIVEAYGEPPQRYYIEAARAMVRADPLSDTTRQRHKAWAYEKDNPFYAFAAGEGELPKDDIAQLNGYQAIDLVKSFEAIGAKKAAGDLAHAAATRLLAANDTSLGQALAVRAIGNYKLAGLHAEADQARALIAKQQLDAPSRAMLAVADSPEREKVASTWNDFPSTKAEWVGVQMRYGKSTGTPIWKRVAEYLQPVERTALEHALSDAEYASLDRTGKLYSQVDHNSQGALIGGDRIVIYDRGTIPGKSTPQDKYKLEAPGGTYVLYAPTGWDADTFILNKPGFDIARDSALAWIKKNDGTDSAGGQNVVPMTFNGPKGFKCNAASGTAIEYLIQKPGFTTQWDDSANTVWVSEVGKKPPEGVQPVIDGINVQGKEVKIAFPGAEVRDRYHATTHMILKPQ